MLRFLNVQRMNFRLLSVSTCFIDKARELSSLSSTGTTAPTPIDSSRVCGRIFLTFLCLSVLYCHYFSKHSYSTISWLISLSLPVCTAPVSRKTVNFIIPIISRRYQSPKNVQNLSQIVHPWVVYLFFYHSLSLSLSLFLFVILCYCYCLVSLLQSYYSRSRNRYLHRPTDLGVISNRDELLFAVVGFFSSLLSLSLL